MKRLLLALGLTLGLAGSAAAQCISVGGSSGPAPQFGIVCLSEPSIATYTADSIALVPAASATDIACITGSATRVIRLQAIRVSGTAGTLVSVPMTLRKNASADTGGTAATGTALPAAYALDSTNPTATATLVAYTANPTINDTTPGLIDGATLPLGLTGTTLSSQGVLFDWSGRTFSQAPILRGVAQQVCVNLNTTSVSSGVLNISFRWTEATQ